MTFTGLDKESAIALAKRVFHVDQPSWIAPGSEAGSHITRYLSANTASEERPGGKHLLVQSTLPLQVEDGSGEKTPVSVTLQDKGDAYVPANPLVPISISKEAKNGVSFLSSDISLAPTSVASSEAPVVVGNRLMWANAAKDTDFIAEPLAGGVGAEVSWQLRSQESPQDNALVFRLPPGESLQMSDTVPGGAEVVMEGHAVLLIPPASAQEANGMSIPVSYTVSGDTLTSHVNLSGSVDFPVMVDPIIYSFYGEYNGDNQWQNWQSYSTCGGCFGFPTYPNLIQLGAEYNWPAGNWGEWYIGVASSNAARIARVDVYNLTHQPANQSSLNIGIAEPNGPNPEIWTTNGEAGAMGTAPLVTNEAYSGGSMAFCADGAGGTDGGSQPLCNEAYGGTSFYFSEYLLENRNWFNWASISAAEFWWEQTQPPAVTTKSSRVLARWTSESPYVAVRGEDSGLGVRSIGLDSASGIRKPYTESGAHGENEMPFPGHSIAPGTSYYEPGCNDPFCDSWLSDGYTVSALPTGVWTFGAWAINAFNVAAEQTLNAYVDKTPPVIETPSWEGSSFSDGSHVLGFSAKDGSSSAPQSGVRLIHAYVDGVYVSNDLTGCPEPKESGIIPSESCLGLAGSWTLESENYGAGPHTLTVWAEDWAGNTSERTFHFTVNHPVGQTQQVGPGSLNLRTGGYELGATDVSLPVGAADLSISRSYNSQSQEPAGPLGPGWMLSTPDSSAAGQWQSLQVLPGGNVEATTTIGQKIVFTAKEGGGYVSPTGFQTYTLAEPVASPVTYRITDSGGDYTEFTEPTGAAAYMPTTVAQTTGGLNKVTYVLKEGKTSEIVGPVSTGESCSGTLSPGCRLLTLHYATNTTASSSEWGEYKGQLASVSFTAGAATPVTIAQYSYDTQGRLRAEWDPRITPALKTTYGYDAEGHLTSLTPPGQESWAFTYGTIAGNPNTGRLLKVTRAQPVGAKEEEVKKVLKEQNEEEKNTEAPKITGTTAVGVRLAVSTGKWSGSPVVYGYRWEDCNSAGGSCTQILGATNQNYTAASSDVGHTLVAQVFAIDGNGAVIASSSASALVVSKAGALTQAVDSGNSLNAVSCVPATTDCVLSDSRGNAFRSTNVSSTSSATWTAWAGPGTSPSEAVECPTTSLCLLADGSLEGHGGSLYYATSLGGTWNLAYTPSYGADAISCPSSAFCLDGQDNQGYFRYATTPASTTWTLEDQGTASINDVFCLSSSFCAMVDSVGTLHVATTTSQAESSSWTTTSVDGSTVLNGVACTSTTSCVAVDGAGNVLNLTISGTGAATVAKHDIDGTNSLTAVTCTGSSTCAIVDNQGNIFVSSNHGETWTKQYQLGDKLTSVSCASTSLCAAADTTGNMVGFNPAGGTVTEGEQHAPQPGSTIEYNVPVSGTGQAYPMSASEVAKWAQTDAPKEADAIFPPDEPEGWPAGDYKRASVIYFDSFGRRVNVAAPGGAISTTQYDPYDNVERSLTPGNRQRAIEAGSESAAKAEVLQTKNTYANEGAELESSTGPQHEVKLASGTVTLARAHTIYHYEDEGAPASEVSYRLVTKTTEGALLTSGKEEDVRTITTSYSGQGNLGWELHKPTSVTVEPEKGKPATRTTIYNSETGDVTEAKAPGGGAARNTQTIYYSAAANSTYPACGKHPEWENLPCQTQPAGQPEGSLPKLPITTTTYNTWDEPLTTTETSGSSTRTTTQTYDSAGRLKESAVSSSTGRPLPTVTNKYSEETGALIAQSTSGTKPEEIKSVYNTLGQIVSYTDAAGKTATYEYEKEKDDRLKKVNDGKGTQAYVYNETTGTIKELTDSAAGTFSAEYTTEGQVANETYPNAMKASYTYDPTGQMTALAYKKGTATFYEDSTTASIHGQWLSQTSTLGKDAYTYDGLGRLTEVQETPQGKNCKASLYTYNQASDRTSETTRESATKECATTGGTTTAHSYDEADRLTDSGALYEPFGEAKTVPAADAGGHSLESAYYSSGSLYSQTEGEQTNTYALDPAGRILETTTTKGTNSKVTTSNYANEGSTPAWTETEAGSWTRNISGIGGATAIQTNGAEVVIQLANLHGDIIGTIPDNAGAEKATLTTESTAFGVPTTTTESKNQWLGAGGLQTEFTSGTISGAGGSYVPQLGIRLTPTGLTGAAAQDPVNEYLNNKTLAQPSGYSTNTLPGAVEPLPVNTQIETEFWEHPPWDKPPVNAPGGPVIDPSVLLTTRQAEVAATAARNGPAALEALAKSGLIGGFTAFLAERLAEIGKELLQGLAYGLELCYTVIHSSSGAEARCRIYVDYIIDPLNEMPKLFDYGVETCWGKSYKRSNSVHWTFPYCTPSVGE